MFYKPRLMRIIVNKNTTENVKYIYQQSSHRKGNNFKDT
jgi:hypothetical protein